MSSATGERDVFRPTVTGPRDGDPLSSFEDPGLGIRERFLTPTLSGVRTVAVLSMPIGRPRPLGWVLCQSFGPEQITLQGVEIPLTRALSAAGFPVLRFHGRGYGDCDPIPDHVRVETHLEDAVQAVELLRNTVDVAAVGLTGFRFGGTVAALIADHLADDPIPVSAVALWEPVVRGRTYVQSLLRLGVMTELISRGRDEGATEPSELLRERGALDVQGFPLGVGAFEEMSKIDLRTDLTAFRGSSLVGQVSKSATPRSDLQNLTTHLTELGGSSRFEILRHPEAHKLGRPRFRGLANGGKADTQADLTDRLIELTTSWCDRAIGGPP
jgi:pimeloyl-ACP methyl ester carboxylesterase